MNWKGCLHIMRLNVTLIILFLSVLPVVFAVFLGVAWIQYRDARHTQQTSPNAESGRKLKLWKTLLIVSGVLFGVVLFAEIAVIVALCAVILFS